MRPVRRQKLQEEKLRHKVLFETQVEVIKTASGHAGKKYRCKKCGTVRATEILIKNHAANCGKLFKGKRRGKNSNTKFSCNQCTWKAGTEAALAKHRREEHIPVGNRRPRCTTCNMSFSNTRNLKRHLLLHMKKVFTCPTCRMRYTRLDNLKRHVEDHHKAGAAEAGSGGTQISESEVDQELVEDDLEAGVAEDGNGGAQISESEVELDQMRSKWDKFMPSDTDSSEGEEHETPLSVAEENRNRRISLLSDLLTSYGRESGESEDEIARTQACLRERMCQPHNQQRPENTVGFRTRASAMTVSNEVKFIWTHLDRKSSGN